MSRRVFVTGATGFVGPHLRAHLVTRGDHDVTPAERVDVTDRAGLVASFAQDRPEVIFHLAARSSVAESWRDPGEFTRVNVLGTMNVLEAAREVVPEATVLIVSTSEVYGQQEPEALPVGEHYRVAPLSPYATSKAEAEHAALESFFTTRQRVIVARPFTHIGPGQSSNFVVPALTQRLLLAEGPQAAISVGNLAARRDICDVRDTVRAYDLLTRFGQPGEIYNVASGHDVGIDEIAEWLRAGIASDARFAPDETLQRPLDVPVTRGDASKLHDATGWEPTYTLTQTLDDVVAYWRAQLPATSL